MTNRYSPIRASNRTSASNRSVATIRASRNTSSSPNRPITSRANRAAGDCSARGSIQIRPNSLRGGNSRADTPTTAASSHSPSRTRDAKLSYRLVCARPNFSSRMAGSKMPGT